MSIKSDRWIRRMAASQGMIEPFSPGQVRDGRWAQDHFVRDIELWLRCSMR
jgi:dCTP deaminase